MNGQENNAKKISITGKILDSVSKKPIEFATISFNDGVKLLGTTSGKNGNFEMTITPGAYTLQISFLSYKTKQLAKKNLLVNSNLGVIYLALSSEKLEEIELVTQRDLVEFKLNKKIYNAAKDVSNLGGNALDVLNNTPAVRVDENGKAVLRGADATILIDGKPLLGLDSNRDVLSSLPSNAIQKVEIITHSAKYSAEGGGILNIITKKRKGAGLSGSFDAHLGYPDNNGASVFLNENTDKINLFSTISFNNEMRVKKTFIDQVFFNNQGNSSGLFQQIRKDNNQRNSFLFNIGSDFYLSDKSTLTSSILINTNNINFFSNLGLTDFDPSQMLIRDALRLVDDFDDISKLEGFMNYTTKFSEDGHQLSIDLKYDNTVSENKASIDEMIRLPVTETIVQKVAKNQDLNNFLMQADYTLPFSEHSKIELGYKGTLRYYKNNFKVEEFDENIRDFVVVGGFNDVVSYNEKIHAVYALYSASHKAFSYSLGLRTEFSEISLSEASVSNEISKNYSGLFPSASLSYEFTNDSYLSANYSRSIDRPQIAQLNPFISLNNERFQSVGNPNLNPFYAHYLELLYDHSFEKLNLASSVYVNNAEDQFLSVIQNTGQNADGFDIYNRTVINSGSKNIVGADLDITYKPIKELRLNSYISPYKLDIKNTLNNAYDFNSLVWYAEASALLTLTNGIRFQAQYLYQSPIENGLTKLRTINFLNLTLSTSLLEKKATLSLRAVDILNSKWFRTQSFEANTNTLRSVRYQPQFTLAFTYRFKQTRRSSKDRSTDVNNDELEDKQDKKM